MYSATLGIASRTASTMFSREAPLVGGLAALGSALEALSALTSLDADSRGVPLSGSPDPSEGTRSAVASSGSMLVNPRASRGTSLAHPRLGAFPAPRFQSPAHRYSVPGVAQPVTRCRRRSPPTEPHLAEVWLGLLRPSQVALTLRSGTCAAVTQAKSYHCPHALH